MPKHFRDALIALTGLATSSMVSSQSCESRFQFKFADGLQGCLTDFSVVNEDAQNLHSSVKRMASAGGKYNIAMTARDRRCPLALGMMTIRMSYPGSNNPDNLTKARSEKAMKACQAQVDAAPATDPPCTCQIVLEDGISPLTQDQFSSYVGMPIEASKK